MGKPNPSFLKRQKEQQRREKAERKRTDRQSRGSSDSNNPSWMADPSPDAPSKPLQEEPPEA